MGEAKCLQLRTGNVRIYILATEITLPLIETRWLGLKHNIYNTGVIKSLVE